MGERRFLPFFCAQACGACIFPEGRLTADGEIAAFRPGFARILCAVSHIVVENACVIAAIWQSPDVNALI